MRAFVNDADQEEHHGAGDAVRDHHEQRAVDRSLRHHGGAEGDEAHVRDARISDKFF